MQGVPKDPEKEKARREKLSKALSGEKHPLWGKHLSQEWRDKIGKAQIGEKNHCWKEKIQKICPVCKIIFEVIPSQEWRECCSRKCKGKIFAERYIGPKSSQWKPKIRKVCPICEKDFNVKPSQNYQVCCSYKCKAKLHSGENTYSWIDGRSYEPYPPEFDDKLRKSIRRRDNFICQKCGLPEIGEIDNRRFAIHHIDYNTKNNDPGNLITLCIKCNAKVSRNRKKWTRYFQRKLKREDRQIQLCLARL